MGSAFRSAALDGPVVLAVLAALVAGLVSFLSPCILPLVPGYLSYVTGLAGADLDRALGVSAPVAVGVGAGVAGRGRVLAGSALFVGGFTVVFTIITTAATKVTVALASNTQVVNIVAGVLIIVFGLAFLGVVPGLQRELRFRRLPAAGLWGAPVFGAVFALSWMPCVGPTLGAVTALAATSGKTDRAVILAVAYALGLGLPFVVFGVAFRRVIGVVRVVRRHSRWVTRVGGVLLIIVGLALVTGSWTDFLIWLQTTFDFGAGTFL
jgi:cytochrome c-type biogenesis protein